MMTSSHNCNGINAIAFTIVTNIGSHIDVYVVRSEIIIDITSTYHQKKSSA